MFWRTHRCSVIMRASLPAQTGSREVGAHLLERAHLMLHVENSKNANENLLPERSPRPNYGSCLHVARLWLSGFLIFLALDWDLADLAAAGLNNSGVQNSPGHGLMAMRCCGTHSVVLASEDLTAPWFQGLSRFSMNGTCSVPEAPHPLRRPLAALVLILHSAGRRNYKTA